MPGTTEVRLRGLDVSRVLVASSNFDRSEEKYSLATLNACRYWLRRGNPLFTKGEG